MTQWQNECACSADLRFERESITNAPLQSPNSHLLPQYFFLLNKICDGGSSKEPFLKAATLFWFGLIHAKRKQTIGILKMPPFCRVSLLTGDEHAHSFCRCVSRHVFTLRMRYRVPKFYEWQNACHFFQKVTQLKIIAMAYDVKWRLSEPF